MAELGLAQPQLVTASCFFETFLGGLLAGWRVGESDFNENPVISLDLDLDFGLRLKVCQFEVLFFFLLKD